MTDRADLAQAFIAGTEWKNAERSLLAGDASNRRYDRLTRTETGETAVFMDAPPEKGEDIRPFVKIARHLKEIGLSAPEIIAADEEHGFLILEDLGDDLYSRVIANDPTLEEELYSAAVDVLIDLHKATLPPLDAYDAALMTDLAGLAFSEYADRIKGAPDPQVAERFAGQFNTILRDIEPENPVLVQRDYHADNLLWLPDRTGVARVGLLDFQDAMSGHPAYDLVSLLQDIRRDVSPGVEAKMIAHYIDETGVQDHAFRKAYAVLGAQRNLRILGVFARLGTTYGKPRYVEMIPKVWEVLTRDLEHPALALVADLLLTNLPQPTPENLTLLRAE